MKTRIVALLGVLALLCATTVLVAGPVWRGRPAFVGGKGLGYFIWRDGGGVHVRWTTKGKLRRFHGHVRGNARLLAARAVGKERGDWMRKTAPRRIAWDTTTGSGIDGFDFRLDPKGTNVTFHLNLDGNPIRLQAIHIGAGNWHPDSNPFTLHR